MSRWLSPAITQDVLMTDQLTDFQDNLAGVDRTAVCVCVCVCVNRESIGGHSTRVPVSNIQSRMRSVHGAWGITVLCLAGWSSLSG